MTSKNRPFSKTERQELARIVSPAAKLTRAVLWLLVVAAASLVAWNVNQKTGGPAWWPVPAVLVGLVFYFLGGRLSGGAALRAQVQSDLNNGEAEERVFEITAGAIFPEIEDEGSVVFLLSGERVYCLSGQRVSRVVRNDSIASQLVESLAPTSRRVIGLHGHGEKLTLQKADVPFARSAIFNSAFLSPFIAEVALPWSAIVSAVKPSSEKNQPEDGR